MLKFYRSHPRWAGLGTGAVIGVVVGLLVIGNFGVASRGQAFSVWGWLLGGCLGAYIGFRIGELQHRRL